MLVLYLEATKWKIDICKRSQKYGWVGWTDSTNIYSHVRSSKEVPNRDWSRRCWAGPSMWSCSLEGVGGFPWKELSMMFELVEVDVQRIYGVMLCNDPQKSQELRFRPLTIHIYHIGFCHVRSLLVSTYKLSRFEQRTVEVSICLFAAWETKNWQRAEGGTRSQVSQCFYWQERSVRSEGMFFLYPNPASASQRKIPWNGPHPFSTTANSWHWHQQQNVGDLCFTVQHSCWIFCRVLLAAWMDGKIPFTDTFSRPQFSGNFV